MSSHVSKDEGPKVPGRRLHSTYTYAWESQETFDVMNRRSKPLVLRISIGRRAVQKYLGAVPKGQGWYRYLDTGFLFYTSLS